MSDIGGAFDLDFWRQRAHRAEDALLEELREVKRLREVVKRAFVAADMDEREECWTILREEYDRG